MDQLAGLVHDAADQVAHLHDPNRPSESMQTVMDAYSPDLRAGVAAIVADPVRHVERKLALLLDGIEGRYAP